MLSFEQKIYNILDYHEFDDIVNERIDIKEGGYECVASAEWNNDECHTFDIYKKEYLEDFYQKYCLGDVEKLFFTGKWKAYHPSVNDILVYLVYHDVIPEGNYMIRVSW